nr:hypothetical protein [uncultured Prevotella sp.]
MNRKKKMIIIAGLVAVILCVLINQLWAYIGLVVILLLFLLNLHVFNKNRFWACNINNLNVIGRNYDTLVIGEPISKETISLDNNKYIFITCPGRSMGASIILAYRLFSLLHSGGTLILAYHKAGEKISSLDIPYIHDVTLFEKNIKRKKEYFPLFLNPIQSLKLVMGVTHHHAKATKNVNKLEDFCKSREIKLLTYKV